MSLFVGTVVIPNKGNVVICPDRDAKFSLVSYLVSNQVTPRQMASFHRQWTVNDDLKLNLIEMTTDNVNI